MKLITISVPDEEHLNIKLKATAAGKSIKDFLLDGVNSKYAEREATPDDNIGKFTGSIKGAVFGTPKILTPIKTKEDAIKVVEALPKDDKWTGPLFRDKGKSKL